MKRSLVICMSLLLAAVASAQDFKYVGADNCKRCHNGTDHGNQYDSWWFDDLHSQAMESLSSPKAKEYAQNNGIADPAKEQRCLKCHSTFHAAPEAMRNGIKPEESISCEGCHGPGSRYASSAIMRNRNIAVRQGMVLQTQDACLRCHNNESPFYRWFDFRTDFAKISHPTDTTQKH